MELAGKARGVEVFSETPAVSGAAVLKVARLQESSARAIRSSRRPGGPVRKTRPFPDAAEVRLERRGAVVVADVEALEVLGVRALAPGPLAYAA